MKVARRAASLAGRQSRAAMLSPLQRGTTGVQQGTGRGEGTDVHANCRCRSGWVGRWSQGGRGRESYVNHNKSGGIFAMHAATSEQQQHAPLSTRARKGRAPSDGPTFSLDRALSHSAPPPLFRKGSSGQLRDAFGVCVAILARDLLAGAHARSRDIVLSPHSARLGGEGVCLAVCCFSAQTHAADNTRCMTRRRCVLMLTAAPCCALACRLSPTAFRVSAVSSSDATALLRLRERARRRRRC